MTKEQKLINVQKQFTNLNAYKTYEQFVSEEVSLTNQQNLYPELDYENVGSSKGYGPCDTCRKDTQWASLSISCPANDCGNTTTSYYYHSSGLNASDQLGCGSLLVSNKGDIKCDNSFKKSLAVAGDLGEMITDLIVYLSKH